MLRTFFKGKIHRATVTESNLNYMGSVTIDQALLEAADILPGEQVQIVNLNNGARLETYVIEGGPGTVCLNGAAARLAQPGDLVIIISYGLFDARQWAEYTPRVVKVDEKNAIIHISQRLEGPAQF